MMRLYELEKSLSDMSDGELERDIFETIERMNKELDRIDELVKVDNGSNPSSNQNLT
jgi:hypothetical protein